MPRLATPGVYTIHIGAADGTNMIRASSIEVEDFVRLRRRPHIPNPTSFEFAEGRILLQGYDLAGSLQTLDLTLFWKSVRPVEKNWKVFVHVVDDKGQIVAQNDSFPGNGLRWTDTWKPGEYVIDKHSIALPVVAENTEYAILVGMYDPETGIRVPTIGSQRGDKAVDSIRLTSFTKSDLTVHPNQANREWEDNP